MKYDKYEPNTLQASDKPLDVNGDVTPVTHEQVQTIQPNKWFDNDVSLEFLNGQMDVLNKRLMYAQQMHQPSMVQHLMDGIRRLEQAITNKLDNE